MTGRRGSIQDFSRGVGIGSRQQDVDAARLKDLYKTSAHHKVSSSSVVEHRTRARRVVGPNPIGGRDCGTELHVQFS